MGLERAIEDLYVEGTTPLNDASGLRLKGIYNLDQLSRAEGESILGAFRLYFSGRKRVSYPYSIPSLVQIHKDMFASVWSWAGEFRQTTQTNIGVRPYLIREELHKLTEDMHFWSEDDSMGLSEQAARMHHRLVWIHPFENGNGRHARFASDLFLQMSLGSFPIWPEDIEKESLHRERYISSLQLADRGDFSELITIVDEGIMHQKSVLTT